MHARIGWAVSWNDRPSGRVPLAVESARASDDESRQRAFERYVVPELEVLSRVASSIVARPADAEDLVQETLLRAYQGVDRFDGAHPRAWLLTIMRNAEINRHRRRRPELMRDPDVEMARLASQPSGPGDLTDEIVLEQQFDGVVHTAFMSLPEKFRRVLELVDIDGLSYAETALLLGVPEGTVMSRVHRARKRIRDRLATSGIAPRRRM
jgi:RNA polymerase sigma-70 factor (ECF subfamily)